MPRAGSLLCLLTLNARSSGHGAAPFVIETRQTHILDPLGAGFNQLKTGVGSAVEIGGTANRGLASRRANASSESWGGCYLVDRREVPLKS